MPERQVGRYTVLDEFAAGGMATIHFGRLTGPAGFSRVVAIKRLHAELSRDPEFVAMFLDEARLAARIRHPNVVSTLDVVAAERELFIVLEYIEGESLARLARLNEGPLPIPIAVAIVVNALHGLHAAHEARDESGSLLAVIHRDVSPQNVIVGVDGVARMVDFGVAKAAGRSQRTRAGVVKGKVAYMAPEQVSGGVIDRRTDIYAAAVMLWELLTGRRLFEGDNDFELAERVRKEGMATPPSKHRRGVSKKLDAIILRAASRNAEQRPVTALAMADALEQILQPASPRQVSEWVTSLAQTDIAQRAARVADVQTRMPSDLPSVTPPPTASGSAVTPRPIDHTREVVHSNPPPSVPLSVSPSNPPPAGGPSLKAIALGVSSAIALFAIALLLLLWLRPEPSIPAQASAGPGVGEPVVSAEPVLASEPKVAPTPSPGPPISSSAEPAMSTPPQASSAPRARRRVAPARTAEAPAPKRDCDPPYYYEGRIKKYKPGCI